jgi:hypothetical protein
MLNFSIGMANQSSGIGCTFQLGYGTSSAGVFVLKVREGGPADLAGINPGDRLLGFFLDSKVRDIIPFQHLFLAAQRALSALPRVRCRHRNVDCPRRAWLRNRAASSH